MTIILLALGGATGALLRATLGEQLNGRIALGTLAANVIASFALGALSLWSGPDIWNGASKVALTVGLLGALSTWSSLADEIADHLRSRREKDAVIVLGLNLVLGIGAAWLGLRLAA